MQILSIYLNLVVYITIRLIRSNNINLTLAIDPEFLNSLNSENTRLSNQTDLLQFLVFLGAENFKNVSRDQILKWKEHLMVVGGRDGEPSAPYTVA